MPALVVLLSCWDELYATEDTKPDEVLNNKLPLLASFIASRWGYSKSAVFGLSALETALNAEKANEKFIDRGPEHFGYVIEPDGSRTGDLTRPIVRVAAMTKD